MKKKRGRPPTFDLRTRQYFARLIEQYGVNGASEASKTPVSHATLVKIAKEFGIRLKAGRRPLTASPIFPVTLMKSQLEQLRQVLEGGAEASGYRSDYWTCRRITEVIQELFGMKIHPAHLKLVISELRRSTNECPVITIKTSEAFRKLSSIEVKPEARAS